MSVDKVKLIKKKLLELSRISANLSINELRVILALERIAARITNHSKLKDHLIFKGGFVMLKAYESDRFTRDIDALGVGLDKKSFSGFILEALKVDLDDGLWFGNIRVEDLEAQGEYGALRFNSAFQIGFPDFNKVDKLSRIHFDIGFGDQISKDKLSVRTKSVLSEQITALEWKIYPPEYILSEKLQTLVSRKSANSRAKDIYDLTHLFKMCDDNSKILEAIKSTFENRNTKLPASFSKFVKSLDLTLLKSSWKSVRLQADLDFETVWSQLNAQLSILDKLINERSRVK